MECLEDRGLKARPWTPPAMKDRRVGLPSVTGPSGFPDGARQGCIEATGHWANCDVWIQAPANWQDVVFVLAGQSGNIETIFDHRLLSDMQSSFTPNNGILLSARGRRCDRYVVYAYRTTVDHGLATFHMELWGQDGSGYGDRATRQMVDLYARQNQIQRYTSGVAGVPVGVPTATFGANPSGGRIAATSLDWTSDLAAGFVATLILRAQPGATVLAAWIVDGGIGNAVAKDWQPPLYTAPAESLEVLVTAPAGTHLVNMGAFYD